MHTLSCRVGGIRLSFPRKRSLEVRSEDIIEMETAPWDEVFIRASPAILSQFLPLQPSTQHLHKHTGLHFSSTCWCSNAYDNTPQLPVNNEWLFYKSRQERAKAASVLGLFASPYLTSFSCLLPLCRASLKAIAEILVLWPCVCWLMSTGGCCAFIQNLSTCAYSQNICKPGASGRSCLSIEALI